MFLGGLITIESMGLLDSASKLDHSDGIKALVSMLAVSPYHLWFYIGSNS